MFRIKIKAALTLITVYLVLFCAPARAGDLVMGCLFCESGLIEVGGIPVDLSMNGNTPVLTFSAPSQEPAVVAAHGECTSHSCPETDWLNRILRLLQTHNLGQLQLELVPMHSASSATYYSDRDSKPTQGSYRRSTHHYVSTLLRLKIVFTYQGRTIRIPLAFSSQNSRSAIQWLWGSEFFNSIYSPFQDTGFLNPLYPQILELVHLAMNNFFQVPQNVAQLDQPEILVSPAFLNISETIHIDQNSLVHISAPQSMVSESVTFSFTSGHIRYAVTIPPKSNLYSFSPTIAGNVVPTPIQQLMTIPLDMVYGAVAAGATVVMALVFYLVFLGNL